jgi:ADP-ribose pyrophosphatase YjhB (NUDIX family)
MINRRVNVRGIIFKDDKLLAQQLVPDSNGKERNYWCTPGGGMEEGESLCQGLTREMVEETGITPKIGKLLFIQQFRDNNGQEQLEFFFLIENTEGYKTIDLSKTSHGMLEIKTSSFIDPKNNNLLPAFLQTIDIKDYINSDKPVFIYSSMSI